MNHAARRGIEIRAFLATGRDDDDAYIWYIDQLERAVIHADKLITNRKTLRPRKNIDRALNAIYIATH